MRKNGIRKWKKTWVLLSESVPVHWYQRLLHLKMAECEAAPLQKSPSSSASWQSLLPCIYTAALVHHRTACLQWSWQLSPLTLLWFMSQSWFRSEEMNCQLKPNEICSSYLQACSSHETAVNLNQTDRTHVLCTPLAISLHRSVQLPKLLIPTLLISALCWDHSFLATINLWHTS